MLALRQIFNLAEFIVTSGQLASISLSACYLTFSVHSVQSGPFNQILSCCVVIVSHSTCYWVSVHVLPTLVPIPVLSTMVPSLTH